LHKHKELWWAWESARLTVPLPCVNTDTTITPRTRARPTDFTGLAGFRAACLSAPGRGSTGFTVAGASMDGPAFTAGLGLSADLQGADLGSWDAVRLSTASLAGRLHAGLREVDSAELRAEDFTVAAGSTAADTGKFHH
jgi:hypothetical protein